MSTSQVIRSLSKWSRVREGITGSMGFVPTMGCLHEGHATLIKESVANNAVTVVSIYVNPTQFNHADDLNTYPRTEEQDIALLESLGVDYVLMPESSKMYPENKTISLETTHPMALCLEGEHRPGHFNGVLTVVMKLLWLVRPSSIYFGDKDYQQCVLVQSMIRAYHIPVSMHVIDTQREESGLPLSSRLKRLDEAGLEKARFFAAEFHAIDSAKDKVAFMEAMEKAGIVIEYCEEKDKHLFVAVQVQSIRLIDHKPWENDHVH